MPPIRGGLKHIRRVAPPGDTGHPGGPWFHDPTLWWSRNGSGVTTRKAHVRTDPRTGRTHRVRAHPVRTHPASPAVAAGPVDTIAVPDPFATPDWAAPIPTHPAMGARVCGTCGRVGRPTDRWCTGCWSGRDHGPLRGDSGRMEAREAAARFVPSEYGWDWDTAGQVTTHGRFERREPGDPTWREFVADIAINGMREPIQVLDSIWVTDGHHRLLAALEAGADIIWETAPDELYEGQVPDGPADYLRHVPDRLVDHLSSSMPDDDDWWADVAARRDRNVGVVAYECRDGLVHVTPGVLDEDARNAFLLGGCGALATAMHNEHGWPIVGLWATDDEPFHVGVLAPDGLVVDIDGAHPPDEWQMAYGGPDACDYEPLTAEETDWVTGRDPGDGFPFGIPGVEAVAVTFVAPVTRLWADGERGWVGELV